MAMRAARSSILARDTPCLAEYDVRSHECSSKGVDCFSFDFDEDEDNNPFDEPVPPSLASLARILSFLAATSAFTSLSRRVVRRCIGRETSLPLSNQA